MSRDCHAIPCGTLGSAGDEARAVREDPAALHYLSRAEREAFTAVQDYLRRSPRATELRACKDQRVDFAFYLAAKRKAVAGPGEWAKCSRADLIRPGDAIVRRGRPRAPGQASTAERRSAAYRDREIVAAVHAVLKAAPELRLAVACRRAGVDYPRYHKATQRMGVPTRPAAESGGNASPIAEDGSGDAILGEPNKRISVEISAPAEEEAS